MHIELLVEEPSAAAALSVLVPRILGAGISFDCRIFSGKMDLLQRLPERLRGYRRWPPDTRIVVLVDEDREDCLQLKGQLNALAAQAGLSTTQVAGPGISVLNRIAVEELEAWFLGDVQALVDAFPGVPSTLERQARYRNPDAIGGGTWEALQRVLQRAGYYRAGMSKIDLARRVSPHMVPNRNRSRSFQVFVAGLQRLAGQRTVRA